MPEESKKLPNYCLPSPTVRIWMLWEDLKLWLYRYIGGIFMEEKNGNMVMSIGRVSFAVVLGVLIWTWYRCMVYEETVTMPPGLMEVFWTVAGYVFGSKVVGAVKVWKNGNGKE